MSLSRGVGWSLQMGDYLNHCVTDLCDANRLRRQTVTAAGTTNFIWDGQDVLMETHQVGSTLALTSSSETVTDLELRGRWA